MYNYLARYNLQLFRITNTIIFIMMHVEQELNMWDADDWTFYLSKNIDIFTVMFCLYFDLESNKYQNRWYLLQKPKNWV